MGFYICSSCGESKELSAFYSKKLCKRCNNKAHYAKHKAYYVAKGLARRRDPDLKEHIRDYNRKWQYDRRKSSLEVRIKGNLRNRLRDAIKGRRKSATTIQLLGCSWDEYKKYIESLWTDGMSWDNYGRGDGMWNIDHIKPLSIFDLSEPTEQANAFHFLNTQPMWEKDNFRKGNRISA